MTGISNLNIVIQQGNIVRDVQQLRASHQASQDVASSILPDKITKEKTSVQEAPDSRKMKWQKDRKRELEKRKGGRNKGKNKKNNQSDHILDTIV